MVELEFLFVLLESFCIRQFEVIEFDLSGWDLEGFDWVN
jgi:hypothetical protein